MPDAATTTIHALPRRALQTLDSHWYAFAKARFRVRYRSRSKQRPALVYTPGKVGSSSVASALAQALAPRGVAHLHFLTPDALARDEQHFRSRARAYRGAPKARRFLPYYVWLGEEVRRAVDEAPTGTVWDVVTMVRDPVQRNVSAFFQNLESAEDVWVAEELRRRDADDVADELVGRFLEAYVHADEHPSTDANPLTWFDDELKPVFGIDVFATPFPTSRGYDTYRSASARLLLIRLEDLSTVAARSLLRLLRDGGRHGATAEHGRDEGLRGCLLAVQAPAGLADGLSRQALLVALQPALLHRARAGVIPPALGAVGGARR